MSRNVNAYDDVHVAEMYDQFETETDDIELLRRLIGPDRRLKVLEPFCGTGRILIPLAMDGHEVVGLDQSQAMLDRAAAKVANLPAEVQQRVCLLGRDVTEDPWPEGFDLVLLGGNCLYELAAPQEQQACIAAAAGAARPGGCVYVDSDHMEGELAPSWRQPGKRKTRFPSGTCGDGTRVSGTSETIWFDGPGRLWRARRAITLTRPDGQVLEREWILQNHPVSRDEVAAWLAACGLTIEQHYGDRTGGPYTPEGSRAIFWARKGKAQ